MGQRKSEEDDRRDELIDFLDWTDGLYKLLMVLRPPFTLL
jgi:hypothetical protein